MYGQGRVLQGDVRERGVRAGGEMRLTSWGGRGIMRGAEVVRVRIPVLL